MSTPNLSLFTIEQALLDLMQAREEVCSTLVRPGPELEQQLLELAEIDKAITEYVQREVQKVDNIRGFLRHCDLMAHGAREEAALQSERARQWEARRDRLKGIVQDVMGVAGVTSIEGRTGKLMLKGNGGVAPLVVTDPEQVPEECCKYVGWISGVAWAVIMYWLGENEVGLEPSDYKLERVVDNERVRAALPVPGAHLGERGQHIEVK